MEVHAIGPHYLAHGDCIEVMRLLPDNSIDACVSDPPYGLGFMGKAWDSPGSFVERKPEKRNTFDHVGGNHNPSNSADAARTKRVENQKFQAWCGLWTSELLRVLKPGAHACLFGGTRTYHRLAVALEDEGFEIRDCLSWLYGTGFPKSLDVSKAIDAAAGATREVIGRGKGAATSNTKSLGVFASSYDLTAPATPEAAAWAGWGTALKPAWEPIILARKPLIGTVAANVQAHGTGGLNIDACRIERGESILGGWPANVVLDEVAAEMLDEQSGTLKSGANPERRRSSKFRNAYGAFEGVAECTPARGADTGGASRFFYVAKPSRAERDRGCDALPVRSGGEATDRDDGAPGTQSPRAGAGRTGGARNVHPTVKPAALIRWLLQMVTPPGGVVLDPFVGSGTIYVAAKGLDLSVAGIEREAEYITIALARGLASV